MGFPRMGYGARKASGRNGQFSNLLNKVSFPIGGGLGTQDYLTDSGSGKGMEVR